MSRAFLSVKKIWAVVAGVSLVVFFTAYASDAVAFRLLGKIDDSLWPHQRFCEQARRAIDKTLDSLNPFLNRNALLSTFNIYELTLSPQDIRYFYQLDQRNSPVGEWQKPDKQRDVTLRHGSEKYRVKMKLHGDTVTHWSGKKKSFQLKSAKDQFVGDKNRLIFNIPEKRDYLVPLFANEVAKMVQLPAPAGEVVAVKINGAFQGAYFMEEFIDKYFLERNDISNAAIVTLSDNWVEDRLAAGNDPHLFYGGITFNGHHTTPFDLEIANVKNIKSPVGSVALSEQSVAMKTQKLFEAIKNGDVARFEDAVDIPKIGAIDAWRTLFGDTWTLEGDNNRMVYSFPSGKFFFVPRNQGMLDPLEYNGGSFEHAMNQTNVPIPLWNMMTRSEKIRQVRNRWLAYFIIHRKDLEALYDRIIAQYLPPLLCDDTLLPSSREVKREVLRTRDALSENLNRLEQQFHYAKIYLNVVTGNHSLDLTFIPDTSFQTLEVSELKLDFKTKPETPGPTKIRLERFDEFQEKPVVIYEGLLDPQADLSSIFKNCLMGFDFDPDFKPKTKPAHFRVNFENLSDASLKNVTLKMRTSLSGDIIPSDDTYVKIAAQSLDIFTLRHQSVDQLRQSDATLAWNIDGKNLTLAKGKYALSQTLVIPEGYDVAFEKGTEILIAPDKSIISFSPIRFEGTPEEKIIIRALDASKPFGTVAIEGTGQAPTVASYLELSGGNEALVGGFYFSGALSVYNGDLVMKHCKIEGNHADDGLNIKYANIQIENSEFISNFADQIDMDFCKGVVQNCRFVGQPHGDANGDGLDLSGSQLSVKNCSFESLSDKGASVGEDSYVVFTQNRFVKNKIGSAAKDSSSALYLENTFVHNAIAIASYRKKQIFGGGRVFDYRNKFVETQVLFKFDADSGYYLPSGEGRTFLESWDPSQPFVGDFSFFERKNFWQLEKTHA